MIAEKDIQLEKIIKEMLSLNDDKIENDNKLDWEFTNIKTKISDQNDIIENLKQDIQNKDDILQNLRNNNDDLSKDNSNLINRISEYDSINKNNKIEHLEDDKDNDILECSKNEIAKLNEENLTLSKNLIIINKTL